MHFHVQVPVLHWTTWNFDGSEDVRIRRAYNMHNELRGLLYENVLYQFTFRPDVVPYSFDNFRLNDI